MTNRNDVIRTLGLAAIALAFMAVARDASAIDRKGIIGFGAGGGSMTCDGCKGTSGVSAEFHMGAMLTEQVALVLDSSGVSREEEGATLMSMVVGPAVQYWVMPRLWVKGGVGAGWLEATAERVSETSDAGLAFLGGIGVEVLQKQKFAIDLQARFTTARIAGERNNSFLAVVGFNFYRFDPFDLPLLSARHRNERRTLPGPPFTSPDPRAASATAPPPHPARP